MCQKEGSSSKKQLKYIIVGSDKEAFQNFWVKSLATQAGNKSEIAYNPWTDKKELKFPTKVNIWAKWFFNWK